jgi:hypothetical protein
VHVFGKFSSNAYIETPVLGKAMVIAAEVGVEGSVLPVVPYPLKFPITPHNTEFREDETG